MADLVLSLIQHYPERHGGPERHGRDSRDGWGYGSNKRMSEGRGLPPPPRFVSLLKLVPG